MLMSLRKKKDREMIFHEQESGAGAENSELHFKFRFPSFEGRGTSFNAEGTTKCEFTSSAFIEVLTTFPIKEINDKETVKIESIEFQEKKVELVGNQEFLELCSEESSDGFLSDGDFVEEMDVNGEDNENIELETSDIKNGQNSVGVSLDFLSDNDFNEDSDNKNDAGFVAKDSIGSNGGDNSLMMDCGDSNKLECLWEHQELIEQLQMELRKAKATGLPTILEESESPKIMDELKPWRINDNGQHEDRMGEVHKFYKSYTEMMRKFDILNYQKMYAMGFLQLADPLQSSPRRKPSVPTLKSLVSQNLWLFKHKTRGSDPIKKFVNELQGDLEVVYVGQMCLSWEILHWQYEKALDLWNSDTNGVHTYNEVAGEFQQFQVLVQRFTENEPFQGPRVQSYVRSRCVLRNLLQVPIIRVDCKDERKEGDEYTITSEMLVDIVEESIRIFWQFVRSDKDCSSTPITGHKKASEPHTPEDLKLMQEVRKTLQKKDKNLRDILRSQKCILRKFRQRNEEDSDQGLHFFAEVDVKLVARVLSMSKISRDQLIWCQNKLSRISFVNRKIYLQPAFLLFPC